MMRRLMAAALAGAGSLRAQVCPSTSGPPAPPPFSGRPSIRRPWPRTSSGPRRGRPGGVVGLYALGYAGFLLGGGGDICGDDACGFAGGLLGAVPGEAIGIGLGAHVVDGGRGGALSANGASFGVLLLSGMVAQYLHPGEDAEYVVPFLQVAAAVWAEVATARSRQRS